MAGRRWLALALPVCALVLAACLSPRRGSQPTPTAAPTIAVSEDAAQRFADRIEKAGREFRLEFTEQEATSYLALRLASSVPLASPQVRFLPGRIAVEGDLTNPVRLHIALAGQVRIVDGRPEVQLQDGTIAGATVPPFLLASLADSISQMLGDSQAAIELQQLEISAGHLVVAGHSRQP